MQTLRFEQPMPRPLTCGGCRHWEAAPASVAAEFVEIGRCGRFAEIRPGTARPRCNICWEPAVAAPRIQDGTRAGD